MATEFKFPDVGEGITEGKIVRWHVREGDYIKADQTLVEIETEKAIVEIPSPVEGTVLKLNGKVGDTIPVGTVLVVVGEKGESAKIKESRAEKTKEISNAVPAMSQTAQPAGVLATPAIRKLAAEMGVDLSKIKGTGPGRRITEDDIRNSSKPKAPKVTFEKYGQILKIPMTSVRKAIADHMKLSKYTAPHSTLMDEIDATYLVGLRNKKKAEAEKKGIKLTYLPFIIKALIKAIKRHPYANSSLDEENEQIIVKSYYNIGIAVQTPYGLFVPVVKNADKKDIFELAKEIGTLSEKAKERKLTIDDMKGGSFTISNYGSIGVTFAVPIINYPEAAILGIGRMQDKPVVVDKKVQIRTIMPISISFDHRVIDGGEAAKFANEFAMNLQEDMTIDEEKEHE
ncbi:MAG: 2-oxo acid dehydrogenase subunit E2 [Candidatus Aenigmarchaeota archaeon]|nr:2-oxo acid dehydrogenase subunit E2 [Candidatus Aenigmarchaeota archaeon]